MLKRDRNSIDQRSPRTTANKPNQIGLYLQRNTLRQISKQQYRFKRLTTQPNPSYPPRHRAASSHTGVPRMAALSIPRPLTDIEGLTLANQGVNKIFACSHRRCLQHPCWSEPVWCFQHHIGSSFSHNTRLVGGLGQLRVLFKDLPDLFPIVRLRRLITRLTLGQFFPAFLLPLLMSDLPATKPG